jgi:hypothetical protein
MYKLYYLKACSEVWTCIGKRGMHTVLSKDACMSRQPLRHVFDVGPDARQEDGLAVFMWSDAEGHIEKGLEMPQCLHSMRREGTQPHFI